MGYYSDVRVMTTHEGFEKMRDIAYELAKEKNIGKIDVLFPEVGSDPSKRYIYYEEGKYYVCFGFDYVKWYEGYKDVDLFMDVLAFADENGIPWQFARVGEESGDVEFNESSSFADCAAPYMYTSTVVEYD